MNEQVLKSILIFTDGACSGNPGPGGWAAVLVSPRGEVRELGGGLDQTTNNEMELMASIEALKRVREISDPVVLYTDSTYVIRGITQWIWGWRKKGWKNAAGEDVSHKVLWEKLSSLVQARGPQGKVTWLYSRGHQGTPGNERCDEIAVAFSKKKWIDLYSGPLVKYPIAIYDLPEDGSLPEIKPKQEKKAAYCYLSKVGGVVYRHSDWASCERRVKGQSGALFKKAMSPSEIGEILKSWGLSENTEIKNG
ncbi:MAG: ribonuclease HI [Bdellovibrio sp. CG10_big_fil_rev_8_21_14_0_10_47_8]|nr:MAG: ribonuclease HI [Bdellovibrio sp. CG10_big_fil_rev_8_21_14_0_10_47_8]